MRIMQTCILVILLCYSLANGQSWTQVEGSGTQISVDPQGNPWITTLNGDIYRRTADAWVKLPGKATDIGVGANYGNVVVIGTTNITGGHGVFQYNPSKNNWFQIPGAGVRVAVDPVGDAWIVDDAGNILRRNARGFGPVSRSLSASDIGIGANGDVWAIGTTPASGGFEIFSQNLQTGTWDQADGGAVRIAVDPEGNPWVVNDAGLIYRMTSNGWELMPGTARDIGIGGNGDVWIVGTELQDEGGYDILKFSE